MLHGAQGQQGFLETETEAGLTSQLLLDLERAVLLALGGPLVNVGGVTSALEQGVLVRDLLLENADVAPEGLLGCVGPPGLTLEGSYPALHLLALNLPRVSVAFMAVPFGLEEAHDTCKKP